MSADSYIAKVARDVGRETDLSLHLQLYGESFCFCSAVMTLIFIIAFVLTVLSQRTSSVLKFSSFLHSSDSTKILGVFRNACIM